MGKNLKGKEYCKGIFQRKDGQRCPRFVRKRGKRRGEYFFTLPEARSWIESAQYADKHDNIFVPTKMTVDTWFEYRIDPIVGDLVSNTRRNYRERYEHNI